MSAPVRPLAHSKNLSSDVPLSLKNRSVPVFEKERRHWEISHFLASPCTTSEHADCAMKEMELNKIFKKRITNCNNFASPFANFIVVSKTIFQSSLLKIEADCFLTIPYQICDFITFLTAQYSKLAFLNWNETNLKNGPKVKKTQFNGSKTTHKLN